MTDSVSARIERVCSFTAYGFGIAGFLVFLGMMAKQVPSIEPSSYVGTAQTGVPEPIVTTASVGMGEVAVSIGLLSLGVVALSIAIMAGSED